MPASTPSTRTENLYRVTIGLPGEHCPPAVTDFPACYFDAADGWVKFFAADAECVFAVAEVLYQQIELRRPRVMVIPAEYADVLTHALTRYEVRDSITAGDVAGLLAELNGHTATRREQADTETRSKNH